MTDVEKNDAFMGGLGVEAYRVGGSIRDEILGREVKDTDYMVRGVSLERLKGILTTATCESKIIRKLQLRDGRQAGWRVAGMDIVLPRREVSTGPGHRDFAIEIDPDITLDEDAQRRDFTFNALYKLVGRDERQRRAPFLGGSAPNGQWLDIGVVYDPTGSGIYDLKHKTVRITHPDSFRDDPLRILRALRFVSVLGHDLDPETRAMMALHADAVDGLSATGHVSGVVFDELSRILMGDDAVKALRIARDTGVLANLLPELAPMIGFDQESKWHDLTVDEHVFKALDVAVAGNASLRVRWSLLFHDAGKPESAWRDEKGKLHYYNAQIKFKQFVCPPAFTVAPVDPEADGFLTEDHADIGERIWRGAAERINVPSRLREDVAKLIRNHMLALEVPKRNKVRRMRVEFGDEILHDLIVHRMCDCAGKTAAVEENTKKALAAYVTHQATGIADNVPQSAADLKITGHDLMSIGYQGRQIGEVQQRLLYEVIYGAIKNDPLVLDARAQSWYTG